MLLFSIPISAEQFIHALNWTLIHSLWQGMLLAITAGVIILLTKKSSSLLRYNLLTIALFLFISAVLLNFSLQFLKEKNSSEILSATEFSKGDVKNDTAVSIIPDQNDPSFFSKATVFLMQMQTG